MTISAKKVAPSSKLAAKPAAKAPAAKPVTKRPVAKKSATKKRAAKSVLSKAAPKVAPKVNVKTKPSVKPAAKPADKPKKQKTIRDSFNMPEGDYALIATLKKRALSAAKEVKKSELLRAGLKVLANMSAEAFANAINAVPTIKTGRPQARK
ncbi:MAG: hypothetical protein ACK5YU_09610 [Burkholderiales bacterium]|jgi:hypothetical protein|nr:hypothetical protein [Betaproteobacteria bacterium]